jgi:hypothetical protein
MNADDLAVGHQEERGSIIKLEPTFDVDFQDETDGEWSVGVGDGVESVMCRTAVRRKIRLMACLCGWVAVLQTGVLAGTDPSAAPKTKAGAEAPAYEAPEVITASIYARDDTGGRPLFKFKRTATRSGSTVHVLREYTYPDGKIAALERAVYQDNALVLYELVELQTGGAGSARIEHDPAKADKGRILFQYAKDASRLAASATRTEGLLGDTLVNDTVGPFLAAHWNHLLRGDKVTCRYIVVPRKETVGFSFRKESETKWHGRDVIELKMEPTSLMIAALVDPLHFFVEKSPPHRVLEYTGRTTPKVGQPGHWTDLDAVTVFDW